MLWLKQSTSITVKIGPFIDDSDGKTAETALTIAQADVRLSKNGGNIAQKTEATSCTHDELGIYGCPIDTTDTATLGRLQLWVHESGALPVWHEFMVVPANVWDSMFGSDKLQVDATQVEGVDATDQIRDAVVDDATRIDASALNTLSGHDPGGTLCADATPLTAAETESEVNDALVALHLDHLLAADYDPASKPGTATALLNELVESDGGISRFTANALEQGPDTTTALTLHSDYDAAKTAAPASEYDTEMARITANVALASVCTETRLAELDAGNLPTDIADVPTVAEMTAAFTEIKGAGWSGATDTLEEIADSIAAAAPLPYHPDASSTVVTGTETNTYADAASDNAVRWSAADTGTGIEMIAEMNLGSGRVATALTVNGYFDAGASRIVEIWYYDYVSAAYTKLSDGTAAKEMRNAASDNDYTFSLPQSATDRATVPGEVKIKFLAAQTNATDELFLDLVEVAGVASGATSPEAIADAIATSDWGESVNHIPRFTGEVLYVAGSTGNDSNSGIYPDSGLATIAAAIAAASAGDYLKVFADSFTEAVNLSKNGLELHGEIGAIITGASGVPLTISADYCRVDEIILTPAAGQIGLVVTGDYNKIQIVRITGGLTAVQDTGTGNEITLIIAEEYTATGFDLQGQSGYVCDCLAKSSQASTRGFYLSNTAADRTVVRRSTSVNNDTAGFEIVAGVVNAAIVNCYESPTCGARVDNGTNTSWRNHSRTDHQTNISSILADTNELQTDDVPGLIGALNDLSAANVNTEVDTALTDIHLDHLLAADYDPASKPGVATALLNELVENDAGVSRFTENALEQAPSGTGASAATIADAVWDEAAADHVAGGSFGAQAGTDIDAILADTNELQTDDVPGLISGLNDPTAAAIRTEMDSNSTQLTAIVADTNELQTDDVPSLIAALNDPTAAVVADAVWDEDIVAAHNTADTAGVLLDTDLATILADTNELQTDDVPGLIGALNDPTAVAIRTEIDSNSTQLAAIVADTNELQTDLADGGRLDLLVDAIKAKTDNLPADPADDSDIDAQLATIAGYLDTEIAAILADTNELQTDLADGGRLDLLIDAIKAVTDNLPDSGALNDLATILTDTNELQTDDVPGLIAALNNLSAAQVNAEADTALADYDPPTKAELDAGFAALNDVAVTDITQRQIPDSYAADGSRPTLEQALLMILQFLSERAVSGTTVTVKKPDGSTTAMSFTLDDDTDPTSITRTG